MELPSWPWLIAILVGAVIVFRIGFSFGRLAAESERIQPISTTRISPEGRVAIDDALRRGDKVGAIKLLRQDTGCELVEAKKTIEAMVPPGS